MAMPFQKKENSLHKVNHFLSGFSGWLMLTMMLLLVTDIIFRSVNLPLQGMAEISVFVMMVVIYLGFARCEEYSEHVGLEIVHNMLSARGQRRLMAFKQLAAIMAVALLLYAVGTDAWSAFETGSSIEGTVELPIWPVKFIMVFGLFFFLLQTIKNLNDLGRRI